MSTPVGTLIKTPNVSISGQSPLIISKHAWSFVRGREEHKPTKILDVYLYKLNILVTSSTCLQQANNGDGCDELNNNLLTKIDLFHVPQTSFC